MSSSKAKLAKSTRAKAAKAKPAPAKRPAAAAKKVAAKKAGLKKAPGKKTMGKKTVVKKRAKPAPLTTEGANEVSAQMSAAAASMETALAAGGLESLSNDSLQKLMAAAVKIYAAKREAGESFLPLAAAGRVTPTDIMVTSSQMLRSGNLQVFELGMWQSWTGN